MPRLLFIVLLLILTPLKTVCQQVSSTEDISWSDSIRQVNYAGRQVSYLSFTGSVVDFSLGNLPLFGEKLSWSSNYFPDARISDPVYAPLTPAQAAIYRSQSLPSQPVCKIRPGTQKHSRYMFVSLVPLRKDPSSGMLEKLVSFNLVLAPGPSLIRSPAPAARTYVAASVLASGDWYKISVPGPGIYRIDVPFLKRMGINTDQLSSANIRLFGNGGQMLGEANDSVRSDDLVENAIEVTDGGDGLFNNSDYLLFYAPGPDSWQKDSLNRQFHHIRNLYNDSSYYFLNFDAPGKRVTTAPAQGTTHTQVTSFNDRQYDESDLVNFLNSGKTWYGEQFSTLPGQSLSRNFSFPVPGLLAGSPVAIALSVAARGISASSFELSIGSSVLGSVSIGPVSGNVLDNYAIAGQENFAWAGTGNMLNLLLSFNPGGPDGQGWLQSLEINCRRSLSMEGLDQLFFRDWNSVGPGQSASFILTNADTTVSVWDLTDPLNPVRVRVQSDSGTIGFEGDCSRLHEYAAFDLKNFPVPGISGKVANQNLHGGSPVNMIIVTSPGLEPEASQLAAYHLQTDHISSVIATTDQIYNEFSSGSQDISAIRDFVKMYYDRSAGNTASEPQYLLIVGSASYDYKNRIPDNSDPVPSWETTESLNPLGTYVSDDFFGYLDDEDDINNDALVNLLDIGVGRIPARVAGDASAAVNKILQYHDPGNESSGRNYMTFVADEGDDNLHLNDAEALTSQVGSSNPVYNIDKIYLDAYHKVFNSAGGSYPDVVTAINNRIFSGTLVFNYTGHGAYNRLSDADILDQAQLSVWTNIHALALFITATCEFGPFDDPAVNSLGTQVLTDPGGGGIGLMTTTRPVYAYSNLVINSNYFLEALQPSVSGSLPSLGTSMELCKNYTYSNFGDIGNNRKFVLLGDPALTLAFPQVRVLTDSVNGIAIGKSPDTLKALGTYTISGHITDASGQLLTGYSGLVYPTVFDKPVKLTTLGNDPDSQPQSFFIQNSILYNGKASISQGRFSFVFLVPKDINYQVGYGKISYYASGPTMDGNGYDNQILIGSSVPNPPISRQGPLIQAYLNDTGFISGGVTNETPTLILRLQDPYGINVTGNGIGHDLTATLDNNSKNLYDLDAFYQAVLNNFQQGQVNFPLTALEPGPHTLQIRAWDLLDNSSEVTLSFIVVQPGNMQLQHVLNYPDPFTTSTRFMFEHNHPGEELYVLIRIFAVSGKLVKSIQQAIFSPGDRSEVITWDGRDDYGQKLARGVYIYQLTVKSQSGAFASALQKLVIL